jgi:hypothetical protein
MCPTTLGVVEIATSLSPSSSAVTPAPPLASKPVVAPQRTESSDPIPQAAQAQEAAQTSRALVPPMRTVQLGVGREGEQHQYETFFDGQDFDGRNEFPPEFSAWSNEFQMGLHMPWFAAANADLGPPTAMVSLPVSRLVHHETLNRITAQGRKAWNATGERDPITGKWVCDPTNFTPL